MRSALVLAAMGVTATSLVTSVAAGPDAGAAGTVIDAPYDLGAPEATAAVSPTEVRLGERFTLFVTAVHGADIRVNLPEPLVLGPGFEVRRRAVEDRRRADGRRIREWQIELVAWELGKLAVPPVPVVFTSGGRAASVATAPTRLRVVGVLGDADDAAVVRGLAPPLRFWQRDWRLATFAGAGVVALIVVVTAVRRRRRPVVARHERARRRALGPTAVDALARLDALEASGLLDRDRKTAYRTMSEIVRDYLGQRYGFSPRDQTTADLRRRLAAAALPPAALAEATAWLDACDLVKYGNHHATIDEARATLTTARHLIAVLAPAAAPTLAEVAPPVAEARHA